MHRLHISILSLFILLFSWSFAAPLFSEKFAITEHHEVSMQLIPCDMDNCNNQTYNPCATHCEGTSTIQSSLMTPMIDDSNIQHTSNTNSELYQHYLTIELKPPKTIHIL